jgi:hypothetical protein
MPLQGVDVSNGASMAKIGKTMTSSSSSSSVSEDVEPFVDTSNATPINNHATKTQEVKVNQTTSFSAIDASHPNFTPNLNVNVTRQTFYQSNDRRNLMDN